MTQREQIEQAARELFPCSVQGFVDCDFDEIVDFTLAQVEKATAKAEEWEGCYDRQLMANDDLCREIRAWKIKVAQADRQAREECVRIAENIVPRHTECGLRVAQAIRATIKE